MQYKNLSSLIKAIDLFKFMRGPGNSYLVRDIRAKKSEKSDYKIAFAID